MNLRKMLNKVPEVTIYFWIVKILCTTVGETAADYLNMTLNFGLIGTSIVMSVLLGIIIFFQFKAKKYIPSMYWLVVVLISIVGTLITDYLTDSLHVPLELTTVVFSAMLALAFIVWYSLEKTLSICSIDTFRREAFYWLVVLFTFALGTAAGDLTAEKFEIGYLRSIYIFGAIAIAAIIYYKMRGTVEHKHESVHAIIVFWIAYIFTRPLGASIGDYLSQAHVDGGLGLGATTTSALFLSTILGLVIYLTLTRKFNNSRFYKLAPIGFACFVMTAGGICLNPNLFNKSSTTVFNQNQKVILGMGDMAPFIKIAEDTLSLVQANELPKAKIRVKDLEDAWDKAETKLRPMNTDSWTSVDISIDRVLSRLRAGRSDPNACVDALKSFIDKVKDLSS